MTVLDKALILSAINILAIYCRGDSAEIIDKLTGYLWDEEDAGCLKDGMD